MARRPAVASTQAAGSRALDINNIPFRLKIEVKGSNANQLQRVLGGLGWSAAATPYDCSHRKDGGYEDSYTTLTGPQTTLGKGGLDNLAQALGELQQRGYHDFGKTAAMHIWIDDKVLDDQGVTNLVNLHLANESLIYRLAQCGGEGRKIKDKLVYTTPLSCNNAYYNGDRYVEAFSSQYYQMLPNMRNLQQVKSLRAWKSELSHDHRCMNASRGGLWQFRYFDPTPDVAAMQGSVKMLLGMVKAAAEGRVQADRVRPLPDDWKDMVSREQWNRFMETVAPDDFALRGQLEHQFVASGGKLERERLSPAGCEAIRRIMGDHRVNRHGNLGRLSRYRTPEDIQNAMNEGVVLSVQPRGEEAFAMRAECLPTYAQVRAGMLDGLDENSRAATQMIDQLQQRGYQFVDTAGKQRLSTAGAVALLADENRVGMRQGHQRGVRLRDVGALAARFEEVIYPERLAALDDARREYVGLCNELLEQGYKLHDGAHQPLEAGRLRTIDALAGPIYLSVKAPQRKAPVVLQTGDAFRNYALAELNRQHALPDAARAALEQNGELHEAGFEVRSANGGRKASNGELAASAAGYAGLAVHDLLGGQRAVVGNLPQLAGELLAPLRQTAEDERHVGRQFFDIVAEQHLQASVGDTAVTRMEQMPWLFSQQQQVLVGFQRLSSWAQVRRVVECQTRAPDELGGHEGVVLAQLDRLRHGNAQVYGMDREAIALRADQVDRFDKEGLRLVLPRRPWWTFFRKNIKVSDEQKLAKIAKRLDS